MERKTARLGRRLLPACAVVFVYVVLNGYSALAADGKTPSKQLMRSLKVLRYDADSMLHTYLIAQAKKQFAQRRKDVEEALRSAAGMTQRQRLLRQRYLKALGPLPERTPLNPIITGVIECEGYRIEKVAYESRPNHHVTANLYIPVGKGPHPAVLHLCGHSAAAKLRDVYQKVALILVRNGFVVLSVDPISQGERYQLLRPDGKPATRGTTTGHTLLDAGANLVGTDVVTYELWDNVRSIDYLVSRPEVDRTRIGCTGTSGGGTQTTFLMAFDDRLGPAAPSCYVMTREGLFDTIGPQDACQSLPSEGALGIDHADYAAMRAPKPTIILAAEKDFFDIGATRQAFAEAQRVYTVLGVPDCMGMFVSNDKHGFNRPHREAMVQWMRKWLMNDDSPISEPELHIQREEDLRVTGTGQVGSHWKDEVSVADLNLARAEALQSEREMFWRDNCRADCLAVVREMVGCRKYRDNPLVEEIGEPIGQEGYSIQKLLIRRYGEPPMPALVFAPEAVNGKLPAALYVGGRGKAAVALPDGPIAQIVRQGRLVLAIDVRGVGETEDIARKNPRGLCNREYRNAAIAIHIGRPLLGQRVEDVLAGVDVLLARSDIDAGGVQVIGTGLAGPVVLHSAAFDERIKEVEIRRSITSWIGVVATPLAHDQLSYVVPSALTRYDLPDLVQAISPRVVRIVEPVDAHGKPKTVSGQDAR